MVGAMILAYSKLSEVNYYLALVIMIEFGKAGGLFPDVDHLWKNVKEKTAVNWCINKIIHITGGKHRSWQTHSIDITLAFFAVSLFLPSELFKRGIVNNVSKEVLSIIMLGFALGWVSHILADMLNGVGVRLVCWNKKHVAFVPKQAFGIKFKTGESWESFVSTATQGLNIATGLIAIAFPIVMKYI